MSALGQKQTYAVQKAMSALPPIATSIAFFGMSSRGQKRTSGTELLDHLALRSHRSINRAVRAEKGEWGNSETQHTGGP
jgi:hypothetical protein